MLPFCPGKHPGQIMACKDEKHKGSVSGALSAVPPYFRSDFIQVYQAIPCVESGSSFLPVTSGNGKAY